jgi:hypothetical protein
MAEHLSAEERARKCLYEEWITSDAHTRLVCKIKQHVEEAEKQRGAEVLAAASHALVAFMRQRGAVVYEDDAREFLRQWPELQPAASALEEYEKRVQWESYGAARILWVAGICDLLKIPKPKPDESGLKWLLREGSHALEALLREERLDEAKMWSSKCLPDYPPQPATWGPQRIDELEKARAEGKG